MNRAEEAALAPRGSGTGQAGRSEAPGLILVTGMGRSGTSLATAVLAQAGARLSDDLLEDPANNPEGMNEDSFVVARNKAIVRSLSAGDRPGLDAAVLVPLLADLRSYIAAQTVRPGFAVKDPRFAILLPLWRRLLADLDIRPRIVFCHRDLASTAASMARAYGMNPQHAADIWLHRAFCFLRAVRRPFLAIGYDQWEDRGGETLAGLRRFARLAGMTAPTDVLGQAGLHRARPVESGVVDAALRAELPQEVRHFAEAVCALRGRIGAKDAQDVAAAHASARSYLDDRSRANAIPLSPDFWDTIPVEDVDALVRKARKSRANQPGSGALPSA